MEQGRQGGPELSTTGELRPVSVKFLGGEKEGLGHLVHSSPASGLTPVTGVQRYRHGQRHTHTHTHALVLWSIYGTLGRGANLRYPYSRVPAHPLKALGACVLGRNLCELGAIYQVFLLEQSMIARPTVDCWPSGHTLF